MFADDCLIFSQASQGGAERISTILEEYRIGSGQLVNWANSTIFLSVNCSDELKQEVQEGLQITTKALGEQYLGLPTVVGTEADGMFNYIPNWIRSFVCR